MTTSMLQSDDEYATITGELARLTFTYRDAAWAILLSFMIECITKTKKLFSIRNFLRTRTIMNMEKEPFIPSRESSESSRDGCYECREREAPHQRLRYWIGTILVHAFILLTTVMLLTRLLIPSNAPASKYSSSPSKYSPIREAVEYETLRHRPDAWSNSIYSEASHESDAAWNELVAFRGVTLSEEEATRLNMSTLPVKDGHATVFGFNHNIHCIRFVRQVIHSDYYYPEETEEQRAEHIFHAHHCLETIRLSVMCVPDLTPLELYWESQEGRKWEVAAKSDSQRECVKWDPLNEWMAPRHYDLNDLALGSELEIDETV